MNSVRKHRSHSGSHSSHRRGGHRGRRHRDSGNGTPFEVRPSLPKKYRFNFFNGKPFSTTFVATDADDALRRAVVSGFIPSNTVMQYYEAVPVSTAS